MVTSGGVISNVAEDLEQKMEKVEQQQQKKPWEESETGSEPDPDEDIRPHKMRQKPKEMQPEDTGPEEVQTKEKKPKDELKGKMVICVEGREETYWNGGKEEG